jgi:hypothetical protein
MLRQVGDGRVIERWQFDDFGQMRGLVAVNVGTGDKGSGERRFAKVHCTRIAIVQVVAPNARDRPRAVPQLARPE